MKKTLLTLLFLAFASTFALAQQKDDAIKIVGVVPTTCVTNVSIPVIYQGTIYTCVTGNYYPIATTAAGGTVTGLTANRAVYATSPTTLGSATTTLTELNYLSGVTSAVQTQLNGKIGGSITANQVAYGSGASTVAGSANLTWDGSTFVVTGGIQVTGTSALAAVTASTYVASTTGRWLSSASGTPTMASIYGGDSAGSWNTVSGLSQGHLLRVSFAPSSGTGPLVGTVIGPTFNTTGSYSGAASAFRISPYLQSTTGITGTTLLIDAGTNTAANAGGTHTALFTVDAAGNIATASTAYNALAFTGAGGSIAGSSAMRVMWSNSTSGMSGSIDSGITRNTAGIIEINNGTAGTYRDLYARNITSQAGTIQSVTYQTDGSTGSLYRLTGFDIIAKIDGGGGWGGGYNLDWGNASPTHQATGSTTGYAWTATGIRLYADVSQTAATSLSGAVRLYIPVSAPYNVVVGPSQLLGWASSGDATGAVDVAIGRNAAGIIEINNGTAGTYRDLRLRYLGAGVAPNAAYSVYTGNTNINVEGVAEAYFNGSSQANGSNLTNRYGVFSAPFTTSVTSSFFTNSYTYSATPQIYLAMGASGTVGITNLYNFYGAATIYSSSTLGTITNLYGLYQNSITNTATGTFVVTNAYGAAVANMGAVLGGGSGLTITNAAGMAIAAQSGATNNTHLLLGTASIPTGNYGIFNLSSVATQILFYGKAASSQSGDLLRLDDNSANPIFRVLGDGTYVYHYTRATNASNNLSLNGNGTGSANIYLVSGATGGSGISWYQNAIQSFLFYMNSGDASLYFRDVVNSRMQLQFTPGATADAANIYGLAKSLWGDTTTNPGGTLNVVATSSTRVALVARAAASSSVAVQLWQDSSGNALSAVNASGMLVIGNTSSNYDRAIWIRSPYFDTSTVLYGIYQDWTIPTTATAQVYGITSRATLSASAYTVSGYYNFFAAAPSLGAGSAITTVYGLYIAKQKQTGVGTGYGIFQVDSGDQNYFAGITGMGASAVSGVTLELQNISSSGTAIYGLDGYAYATTASANAVTGMRYYGYVNASGSQTGVVYGAISGAINAGAGGASSLQGLVTSVSLTGAGNVTNGYGAVVSTATASGGGAFTSVAGLAIAAQSVATNNTALLIGTTTIPSGNFSIYQASTTAPAYFNGSTATGYIGIGAAPAANTLVNASAGVTDPAAQTVGLVFSRNVTLTGNNTQSLIGIDSKVDYISGAFNPTGKNIGLVGSAWLETAGTASRFTGVEGYIYNVSTGTITNATAIKAGFQNLNAGGTITSAYSFFANESADYGFNSGTIGSQYGLYVANPPAGTLTNNYGVYVENMTRGGTLNYAIYSAGGASLLNAGTASVVPLTIKGAASQSGDYFDIVDSSSTNVFKVTSAGNATLSGALTLASAAAFSWSSRSALQSPSDGVIELSNNAGSDFTRLQFGGTSSSFPSIKRSTTSLAVRLADDSADASLTALGLTLSGNFFVGPSTIETFTTTSSAFSATLNYYTDSQTIYRNTGTAANDVTVNVDASASVGLDTRLATGQAITVVVTITNGGGTAYKVTALNIHGSVQTIKWPNGTAPTAGLNEEDWYTFTIMKTAANTYYVTGVMTAFK